MLRTEDLMIGDWVLCDGKTYQIAEIGGMVCLDAEEELFASLDEVEPIPLTPEILEKNGFSGEGYNMGVIGFHTDPIPEVKDGYEVFIWKDMCLEIKHGFTHLKRYTFYVHELQHALRLCGINLEIKL